MTPRNQLLALLTLLCIAALVAIPFIPEYVQPFDATTVPGQPAALKILPSSVGLPMPEGLKAGDTFYFSDVSPRTRSFFMSGSLNAPAGTSMDLVVHRADGIHEVTAPFGRVPFLSGSTGTRIIEIAGYLLTILVTTLGLVLLWRGRNRAALGVALWCFTSLIENVTSILPLPPPYGLLLSRIGAAASAVLTLVGLYLVAMDLAGSALRPETRRRLTWLFGSVLLAYCIGMLVFDLRLYYIAALDLGSINVVRAIHLLGFGIPLLLLIGAYGRATPLNQARIRWVLFSMLGLVATYLLNFLPGNVTVDPVVINIVAIVLSAASFTGFAYAVLKHQLVSLQFVLNRALVYGLITSLVVGVFAALLSFLERTAFNTETNSVAVMVVILLLGMGMNALKRTVDAYINKWFFRHRHRAEESLAQFARTCAYVEDPEKLLDLTADELFRHGTPQALAIYLTEPGKAGAKLVRQRGVGSYANHLDIDDLGFLRLRAGDLEVDLHGIASSLGTEGNVYAFTVRGQVLGFIVLGSRPAEAYTSEERRLFALVAHQVAVALHALRLEEEHRLLRELAEGAFTSLPTVQAKAKELIQMSATG